MDSRFLRWLYLGFVAPLIKVFFYVGALFNPKLRAGLEMRQTFNGLKPWLKKTSRPGPVWFHCASGEFEYAKPVIKLLREREPDIPILVTYFSPSARAAVSAFPGVELAVPMPWESVYEWTEFLQTHAPRALLIARTDTWPEMLFQTSQHQIPSLLFAATLVKNSGRLKWPARIFTKFSLAKLTQIFSVSEGDATLFAELGFAEKTRVAGDTRFDQVLARLEKPKPVREEFFNSGSDKRLKIVAGSTWSEDEQALLPAIVKHRARLQWVIVPHEPSENHLVELEARLSALNLRFTRYSQPLLAGTVVNDILIVDQVGILAELYAKADFAFVGGSFRKTVHSVMEPLAAGCPTFMGPLHENNREALEFKQIKHSGLSAAVPVADATALSETLEVFLNLDVAARLELRQKIRNEVHKRSGRSELVYKWLKDQLTEQ